MEISVLSRKILRELCTNSREPISEISDKLGISRYSATERIQDLEKALDLRYTLELSYDALSFSSIHILAVKFSKKPKFDELKSMLSKSRIVQFATTTKGDFDLLIFAVAKDKVEYVQWETALQLALSRYGVAGSSYEVYMTRMGFLPLNNENIIASSIKDTYKKLLTVLNDNSRMPIRSIGKKLGIDEDLVRYYMLKLEKNGVIKRFTAIVTKPSLVTNIVFFGSYTMREGLIDRIEYERRSVFFKEPDEFPTISEIQAMWSVGGSAATFEWGAYSSYEKGMKNLVEVHRRIYEKDSVTIKSAVIDQVVKGQMPIRNLDIKENYDKTSWPVELI